MAEPSSGLFLRRTAERTAEIDALADLCGGRVGLGVLDDLNRRARWSWAPGRLVARALTWDVSDRLDQHWWPQGITTSRRTDAHRDVLAVAWYRKSDSGSHDGVRVSLLDPARRRYRHVLLVEPVLVDGRVEVRPLPIHGGGLVWHREHLHVAATARGFWSFRPADMVRVPDAVGNRLDHRGHRYLLPARFLNVAGADEGVEPLRYSFFTLDRSSGRDPSLVVGEYGSARRSRRLVRFGLDPDSGLPAAGPDGVARPVLLSEAGRLRMQGAAVADGTWYVSASQGRWTRGTVYVGDLADPEGMRAHRRSIPMGPEDLVWWPEQERVWCASEHPGRRWVFGMAPDRRHAPGR